MGQEEVLKKIIRALIINPMGFIILILSHALPRDENIWIFYSWSGVEFKDNTKYLYLHISTNNPPRVRAVWITKNKELTETLKQNKLEAYYIYDLKGIYLMLRAKYFFFDQTPDFPIYWFTGGATKIQLWHGLPLKKIGRHSRRSPWRLKGLKRIIAFFIAPWGYSRYDYVLSTSKCFTKIFADAFDIPPERVLVLGYPRVDILVNKLSTDTNIKLLYLIPYQKYMNHLLETIKKYKFSVFYLPTFRDHLVREPNENKRRSRVEKIINDIAKIDNILQKLNGVMFVKLHPAELHYFSRYIKKQHVSFKNVHIITKDIDIYPILSEINILITDYSSVFFDFAIPKDNHLIVFYAYDLEKYVTHDREFYFDYHKIVPGPIVYDIDKLVEILIEWKVVSKTNKKTVKKLSRIFYKSLDGKSSQRVYTTFIGGIKNESSYPCSRRWKEVRCYY